MCTVVMLGNDSYDNKKKKKKYIYIYICEQSLHEQSQFKFPRPFDSATVIFFNDDAF